MGVAEPVAVPDSAVAKVGEFCTAENRHALADKLRNDLDVSGRSITIVECRSPSGLSGPVGQRSVRASSRNCRKARSLVTRVSSPARAKAARWASIQSFGEAVRLAASCFQRLEPGGFDGEDADAVIGQQGFVRRPRRGIRERAVAVRGENRGVGERAE